MARIKKFLVSIFPLVAVCLIVSNFVLSCCAARSSSPQFLYKTVIVTNEVLTVVSNLFTSSSAPTNISISSSSRVNQLSENRTVAPFQYILLNGSPVARLFGRYYYEGDQLSQGLILRIFPDRIYLHSGHVIENSFDDSPGRRGYESNPSKPWQKTPVAEFR